LIPFNLLQNKVNIKAEILLPFVSIYLIPTVSPVIDPGYSRLSQSKIIMCDL
jgi:hypothetical protein